MSITGKTNAPITLNESSISETALIGGNYSVTVSEDIYEAIRYAGEKGVVVVSSVGNKNNENAQSVYFPAAYDTVIGVGAICKDGSVAPFS